MLGRKLGQPSGDVKQDIGALYDYIAYLTEQLEYSQTQTKKQLEALKKGEGET